MSTQFQFSVWARCKSIQKQVKCEEVGDVKGVHLLSGEVRSVDTALKVVEEVQEEVQEVKDQKKMRK